MADPRFFRHAGPFRLIDLAREAGASIQAADNEQLLIHDVASLDSAGNQDLSVFHNPQYAALFATTRAGAVITSNGLAQYAPPGARLLLVAQPQFAYAQIAEMLHPAPTFEPNIDAAARIDPSAKVGNACRIDAGAIIDARAEIGAHTHIAHNVIIGEGVVVGGHCRIGTNTSISHALIDANVQIATCVCIGKSGFGFAEGPSGPFRLPHLGRVIIQRGVEIGANCTIDRGMIGDTLIGAGSMLDNQVHIGHSVRIGAHCMIAGQVGIAGSTVVGDGVMIGGQAGISDHLTIGSRAQIAAGSGVIRNVAGGAKVGGYPAVAVRRWHRQTVRLNRVDTSRSRI